MYGEQSQQYIPRPVGTDHAEWSEPSWDDVAAILETLGTWSIEDDRE